MNAWRKPITLAIVGAEKAGTTSLFNLLSQSPCLAAHQQAEMTAFVNPDLWERGEDWAQQHYFADAGDRRLLVKDVMLMGFPDGLQRLRDSSPGVRVIVMLREPAARAWSAYHYARSRGVESCVTFTDALATEAQRMAEDKWRYRANLYLHNSTYAPKLRDLISVFGEERVLVLYQNALRDIPALVHRLSAFCGIELFTDELPESRALNRAARARSQAVARVAAGVFRSRNPLKRALRAVMPDSIALKLRRTVLRLNRVEAENPPIPVEQALEIRSQLHTDAIELKSLVGHCPWLEQND